MSTPEFDNLEIVHSAVMPPKPRNRQSAEIDSSLCIGTGAKPADTEIVRAILKQSGKLTKELASLPTFHTGDLENAYSDALWGK